MFGIPIGWYLSAALAAGWAMTWVAMTLTHKWELQQTITQTTRTVTDAATVDCNRRIVAFETGVNEAAEATVAAGEGAATLVIPIAKAAMAQRCKISPFCRTRSPQ